ncbi:LysR family transcriptional regulator [Fodinicola acaciae]|uniref:LysR family transcriptional regulator n=1 Tax=Fodinicola acaciae TaxID=2681555 RepID=UPI0013D7A318|nr:LysR family transcriptional regulator [Fodinicola acaciae]
METRRLRLLLELSRLGSMHAVAEFLQTTTSTVSQQIAALSKEFGVPLIEPDGRRVRLTPAGRRLADHAVRILAAVEAAKVDFDPRAEPAGTLRVSGFATAIRRGILPIMAKLAQTHPRAELIVYEHEPAEAVQLLTSDDIDLALTYDYNLAPAPLDPAHEATRLWSTDWGLGVPADAATAGDTLAIFREFASHPWIGNSRNRADEDVVRTIGSMAGRQPRLTHQADSLDLVEDMIIANLGVGLLPGDRPTQPGVRVLPLRSPEVQMRAYALTRRGREIWPLLALVLRMLRDLS